MTMMTMMTVMTMDIDISELFHWGIPQTASSASLASQRSRKGSKHGQGVATGQPAEKPTGTAPNPCELRVHEKQDCRNQRPRHRHRKEKGDDVG